MTETPEVLVVGETLIDFLPESPGRLATVESFSRRAGGAAANVAVGLSRLGYPPAFLTNIASDGFGDFLVETLAEEGITTDFVTRDPAHETTLAFVSHDGAGDRRFTFHGTDTADGYLDASEVSDERLGEYSWIAVDAPVALAEPGARNEIFDLCERAREQGCGIAVDPNTRHDRWADDEPLRRALDRLLSLADLCKASVADFRETPFDAADTEAIARKVLDAGPHTAFLTEGETGASVRATDRAPWGPIAQRVAPAPVEPIDTTGAGDAFLAGVLAGMLDGTDIETTLRTANRVAGLTTTAAGAMAALPDREALAAFEAERA